MLKQHIPLLSKKHLRFKIQQCDVEAPDTVLWKVLNRGAEAERRNKIRGQIIEGNGKKSYEHIEHTEFKGEHYVECYVIKDGTVVARAKQLVPIEEA